MEDVPAPRFTPTLLPYRVMYATKYTLHGRELHLQFSLDETDIFHATVCLRRPTAPIVVRSGSAEHSGDAAGTLSVSDDRARFSFAVDGRDALTVQFHRNDRAAIPKSADVRLEAPGAGAARDLCSDMPVRTAQGGWGLDFQGRAAAPSRLNCSIVDRTSGEVAWFVRVVDSVEINCDARAGIPPACLFAFIVCLNVCPF
jgi:hypothetical protein